LTQKKTTTMFKILVISKSLLKRVLYLQIDKIDYLKISLQLNKRSLRKEIYCIQ